ALTAGAPLVARMSGPTAWEIGRGLLVQGFVAGLVIGVSGALIPPLTRGEPPRPPGAPARRRRSLLLHLGAALAFFLSFPIEALVDIRFGWGVRALVATAVLLLAARVDRFPTAAGLHRRLVWLGAWLVPLGFWMGALAPRFQGAALHVLFVGGFAQLALAVAAHLVLSTDSAGERAASPWIARSMALFLAAAFGARIVATVDLPRVASWLAIAAAAFSCAIFAWAALAVPALIPAQPGVRLSPPISAGGEGS
ncbi:MAG TPA: NnrS family protein, partial [Myxococcaceae bacterium]|nr:NnrS family protein [Myxococcaceae bacterium]